MCRSDGTMSNLSRIMKNGLLAVDSERHTGRSLRRIGGFTIQPAPTGCGVIDFNTLNNSSKKRKVPFFIITLLRILAKSRII